MLVKQINSNWIVKSSDHVGLLYISNICYLIPGIDKTIKFTKYTVSPG